MTKSSTAMANSKRGAITGHAVKQISKFVTCLIGTIAMCLSTYIFTVDNLVPDTKVPATYKWFLLKEVPGPRIIFESGSNSHHAINTEVLGAELGMTAINIGDNAGYALEDKISRLENFARPGDVIVLPLEWSYYNREKLTDDYVESIFSETRDYYRTLPLVKRIKRALSLPPEKIIAELKDIQSRPTEETESPAHELFGTALTLSSGHYTRAASIGPGFGVAEQSCDDYILGKPNVREKLTLGKNVKPALARLKKVQARGIDIHFAWPVLAGEGCMSDLAYVKGFKAEIEHAVTTAGFEFLGTPSQSLYGQDMQDDTPYHLIAAGTEIHTQKMIGFLKAQGHSTAGKPIDIKAFARHRLLELELAEAAPLKQPALPFRQEIYMEDPDFRSHIDFTAGWWAFEPYGRWMRDNRAMLRVTLPAGASENSVLKIQGVTKSGRPERVSVSINGELVSSTMFGEGIPLLVPTTNLPKGEALSIFLTLPEAGTPQSPLENGESEDARSMTLLLQSLEFMDVSAAHLSVISQAVEETPADAVMTPIDIIANTPPTSATNDYQTVYKVQSPAASPIIFGKGWWDQEISGRWMKDGEAAFKVGLADDEVGAESRRYMLLLEGDFFMDRRQAVSFLIDGKEMGTLTESTEGLLAAYFEVSNKSDYVSVKLKLSKPSEQSPKALGLSSDERALTYFLKSAALTPT